jgi:hypothetical protein
MRNLSEEAVVIIVFIVAFTSAIVLVAVLAAPAEGEAFRDAAAQAIASPDVEPWKKGLFREGLAAGWPQRACSVSLYHPKEAEEQGVGPWTKWTGTATGTLVRPGVASCGTRHRSRWLGAWLWIKGLGVHKVEDVFPRGSEYWFDVAVPSPVRDGRPFSYEEWLSPQWVANIARDFSKRPTSFVVLRPPKGWKQ